MSGKFFWNECFFTVAREKKKRLFCHFFLHDEWRRRISKYVYEDGPRFWNDMDASGGVGSTE